MWANLQRIVEKRGRTGRKGGVTVGDTLERGDIRVKAIKNRGVTPSVAAPGVIHPSDATGCYMRVLTAEWRVHYCVCL